MDTISDATNAETTARWTFACSRCPWNGFKPEVTAIGFFADCPECGCSCTTDEPTHEPISGQADNN